MSIVEAGTFSRPKYGKKAKMGTMCIVMRETKVLLIHRRLKTKEIRENGPPDTWSFPGGGVDEDETPEEAVVREVKEEVDLDVEIVAIGDELVWGSTDDFLEEDQWRCFIYLAKAKDPKQEAKIMEPNKHVGPLKWISWKALWQMIKAEDTAKGESDMRFFPTMKNMVEKYPQRSDPACLWKRL